MESGVSTDEQSQEQFQLLDVQSLLTLAYFLLVLAFVLMAESIARRTQARKSKGTVWTSTTTTIRRLYASVFKK